MKAGFERCPMSDKMHSLKIWLCLTVCYLVYLKWSGVERASHYVRGRACKKPERQKDRFHLRRGRKHLEIQARKEADRRVNANVKLDLRWLTFT